MFLLAELPNQKMMTEFSRNYSDMDVATTSACLRILKVGSVLLQKLEKHFLEHGLSQARFLALIVIERESSKQLMPVEISRKMGISKKNTKRLIDFMAEDGLVSLSDHETDLRASIVKITSKGKKVLATAMPGYYKILNKTLSKLDRKSKILLAELLDQAVLLD